MDADQREVAERVGRAAALLEVSSGDWLYLRLTEAYGIDPTVIRKTWTIYDVCAAHDYLDLKRVGEHAAHEINKRKAKQR